MLLVVICQTSSLVHLASPALYNNSSQVPLHADTTIWAENGDEPSGFSMQDMLEFLE
jgi:hypothetical protein